jgi:hypothetical protein
MELLEAVTVWRSRAECENGCMGAISHNRAVQSLTQNGVVVLKSVFTADRCVFVPSDILTDGCPFYSALAWGGAAVADLDLATKVLCEKGVDIASSPVNYHELGMREDFRMDLRNSPHMTRLADEMARPAAGADGTPTGVAAKTTAASVLGVPVNTQLPLIHALLQEVCNPAPADLSLQDGNWGRWNFGGAGPGSAHAPLAVAAPAAVISLPGCADQAVHADTPHLYEHVELPPHYINMFVTALDTSGVESTDGYAVGQTAFLVGSHKLRKAASLMSTWGKPDADRSLIESALIRPQCQPGDVILFDCRVLHFGLANTSNLGADSQSPPSGETTGQGVRRPMIYVNYHQPWWARTNVDKNFEKERLFDNAK